MRLRWLPLLSLLAFFLAMVLVGAIPGEASALSARFGDKLLHTLAFALMTVLAHQSLAGPRGTRIVASISLVAILGLIDEGIQYFLPYRNASLLDWCFDIGSALIVTSLFFLRGLTSPQTN